MKNRVKTLMIGSYLLILIINLVIYLGVRYETEKKMRDFYIESQLAMMKQAITGIDGELETVRRFGLKLTQDPYVQLLSFAEEPLDRHDLENIVKLVRNIRANYTDNPFIEDFYIYYAKSGRVANGNSFYKADSYYRQEWHDPNQKEEQWRQMLVTPGQSAYLPAAFLVNGGKQGEYIPYLYRFDSLQEHEASVLVVLLKKAWLDEWLNDISEGGRTVIRMGAGSEALLTFGDTEQLAGSPPPELSWSKPGEQWKTVVWKGEMYLATRLLSEQNAWQYESLIPYERITAQMKESTRPMLIGLLLYGMIGIPACLFLAFKSYKPIGRLSRQVENLHQKYQELEAEHDDTLQEYSMAAEKIKKNRERIQENILQQLIAGIWQDEHEMKARLKAWDINFSYDTFCVVIIRVENHIGPEPGWGYQERALAVFVLKNVARELLAAAGKVYTVSDDSENISLLLNLADDASDGEADRKRIAAHVQQLLEQLRDYLQNILQLCISIGVGTVCSRCSEVNVSFEQAKKALQYRFIVGKSTVILYNDGEMEEKTKPYYPNKKVGKALRHAVVRRDNGECEQLLDELYQEALTHRITIAEGRQLHIFLTDLAMQLIAITKTVERTEVFCQEIVGKMLGCDTLPEMFPLMKELLNCLCNEQQAGEQGLGTEAVQYIKNNYRNANLSLQLCADVFGVTPEHLSRTIKQETGRTFMESVNYLRIEHAKYHLLQSEQKMEEIARRSGFGTAKSFFRSFKQAEGTSPGAWRKIHKGQEISD